MGEPLLIDDVYRLDASVPYKWSKGFDKRFNYRTKSMLTVPLKNMAQEVVGVLQLMNKKKDPRRKLDSPAMSENVVPFSHSDEDFVRSIGSFAAVSIERVQLYQEIEDIFEGFLSSSAAAIDERDRVTSGHSLRVAEYAMALVNAINAETEGPFGSINFSEERKRQFKFAAYLHDIGKIGVPEALLTKECKLSDASFVALESRADYIKTMISWKGAGVDASWKTVQEVDDDLAFIRSISKAGFLPDDGVKRLEAIRAKRYRPAGGEPRTLCSEAEWEQLSIRKGNLTDKERDLINSHAVATRRILTKIPWTRELRDIPYIASHHHEKLDGSGYPDRLKESDISLECRILAVVDIYEALVSQDRPYKPRMPVAKAVEILRSEAKAHRLDAGVVEFFVAKGLHQLFVKE
jgi:HD-GYP domain-containing protein (c-di-GMP phosphodiesterase class II)